MRDLRKVSLSGDITFMHLESILAVSVLGRFSVYIGCLVQPSIFPAENNYTIHFGQLK